MTTNELVSALVSLGMDLNQKGMPCWGYPNWLVETHAAFMVMALEAAQ